MEKANLNTLLHNGGCGPGVLEINSLFFICSCVNNNYQFFCAELLRANKETQLDNNDTPTDHSLHG